MSGSHSLEKFINGVARDIQDPESKVTAWKRLQARGLAGKPAETRADLRIGALGSGSDYTAFIDHLGVPSLNLGYGGEDEGGIYHSIYDDFYWYTHFSDTDFVYGRALAQTAGLAVMRLADTDLLPFEFENLTDTVRRYATEVENLARDKRQEIVDRNRNIDRGVYAATLDPRRPTIAPKKEQVPPFLNFAPLSNAVAALQQAADAYRDAAAHPSGAKAQANARLIAVERALTLKEGLPNRPWFRHMIYAPGLYTGYGVKTLPGVRESIEQGQWKLAEQEIARTAGAIEAAAAEIRAAATALK
jgi:N-acetylated-alpha-linked acidic dipeptidase